MRSAVPLSWMDRLPEVTPSLGVRAVSPETSCRRSGSTSSSSDTICVSAVRMPCPSSTLPVKKVTVPSALMRSHASRRRLVLRLPGQGSRRLGKQRLRAGQAEGHEQRAALQEAAAGEGDVHHSTSVPAARWIALMMRVCVPQRHRLLAMALRICSSLGCGTRASSCLAVMIIPLLQ